jgi:hypothetical protein
MLKPVPLAPTRDTVIEVALEFVSVSERVFLDPVCTEPKLKLVGLAASWLPTVLVPESATFKVESVALLVMAILPPNVPADFGANVTT